MKRITFSIFVNILVVLMITTALVIFYRNNFYKTEQEVNTSSQMYVKEKWIVNSKFNLMNGIYVAYAVSNKIPLRLISIDPSNCPGSILLPIEGEVVMVKVLPQNNKLELKESDSIVIEQNENGEFVINDPNIVNNFIRVGLLDPTCKN